MVACRSWTWTLSCDDLEAEFVAFAQGDARFDAAAGEPHAEGVGMVIAAVVAALDHRRAAELAAPDDQGVVEQAALFEVFHQRGGGLIGVAAVLLEVVDEVAVLVPRLVEQFNEPHAALDQPPRQQAIVGEARLAGLRAVHVEDVLRLAAMSITSGVPPCMRKAISKEFMRVEISGSPNSSYCILFN